MNPIILIRHGQAEHNIGELTGGWSSTSLTELGRRQVEALASRLERELTSPCLLYHSDIRRATQTAEIIAEATGITPIPEPGLREFNNGVAADKTTAEAEKLYTPPTDPIMDWQPYPEAETWREFYDRVSGCMDAMVKDQDRPIVTIAPSSRSPTGGP
jgi:probable phosphoglycerate mutase